MPIMLRDGKLVLLRTTSQMLLRDGKVVEHYQPYFVEEMLDNQKTVLGASVSSPRIQGATPRWKSRLGGSEALKLRPSYRKEQGLTVKMNDQSCTQEYSSERNTFNKQGITSDIVEETSVSTKVTSKKVLATETQKILLRKTTAYQTPKSKIGVTETVDANARFSLGNGEFATSTPVASASQNYLSESNYVDSFVQHEREITADTTNLGIQDSFTKITKKTRRRTDAGSSGRLALSPDDWERQENIEDSIFEDLSKPFIYADMLDLTDIDSTRDQTDFSKSTSFSYFDSVILNHARWSIFHHWRRQWYLDRYDIKSSSPDRRWLHRAYTILVSMLVSIQTFITTQILFFRSTFNRIWFQDVTAHKRERAVLKKVDFMTSMPYLKIRKDKGSTNNFFNTFCIPTLLIILAFLLVNLLLWPHSILLGGQAIFNLTTHGMKNARYMKFEEFGKEAPVWHVLPYGETTTSGKSDVGNKFPVTFYIHNSHSQNIARRIEIFKALSSIGYNVIIPVFPALNIATGWKGVAKMFNQSTAILWGEKESMSNVQELAKDLCREGFPPSGVVIEIEEELTKNSNVKELEVWTCNCTAVKLDNGSPFSYAHVSCPLGINIVHKDIVHCLQALRN